MVPSELIARVARACGELRVRYAIVGSVAAGYYGDPRMTADVDIVVELTMWNVSKFCEAFSSDEFYVSVEAARAAVERGGQFNIIHPASGFKIDIMSAGEGGHDELQLDRARSGSLSAGEPVFIAAPEDVILKKLVFYKEGSSDKHLRDITGMIRVLGWSDAPLSGEAGIDRGYLEQWALRLGVAAEWRAILTKLGVPGVGG